MFCLVWELLNLVLEFPLVCSWDEGQMSKIHQLGMNMASGRYLICKFSGNEKTILTDSILSNRLVGYLEVWHIFTFVWVDKPLKIISRSKRL